MIDKNLFKSYFRSNFWRPFKNLPVTIHQDAPVEKERLVNDTFEKIANHTYYPSTPRHYLMKNKGCGVVRIIPIFEPQDYIVYYYCIIRLEPLIAINRVSGTFGGWSLDGIQHRSLEKSEVTAKLENIKQSEIEIYDQLGLSVPSYSFNPSAWAKMYSEFNTRLFEEIKIRNSKYYAEFDIANFYDSIRLDILERKIRQRFNREYEDDLNLLFHFLQYWSRDINRYNKQAVGIPQEAMNDCSRILANFYLQEYDLFISQKCNALSASYFRYCDDQFIFSDSKRDLEYLIFQASKRLKSVGLSLNQKKVNIGTVDHLVKHRSFDIFNKISTDDDKRDALKVESFVDDVLDVLNSNALGEIKQRGMPLLNRSLFLSLDKIPIGKRLRLLAEFTKDEYLLDGSASKFKRIYDLIQNDHDKNGLLEALDRLSATSFHNFYHYELLKFYTQIQIPNLHVKNRIKELSLE